MDNCDLEKLSCTGGKLDPPFKPDITSYKMTVESKVSKVTVDLLTSDCGASYKILFGDGSKTMTLNDGVNVVAIEVVAEDGTTKKYCIEINKLSATSAKLCDLAIGGKFKLHPPFSDRVYDYSCVVPTDHDTVVIQPKLPDKNMQVTVNEESSSKPVPLNVGETVVAINVSSADGSNSQVYSLTITREQIPVAVTFCNVRDQIKNECPVSLTAFYRPISINQSRPKHIFSAPYIDMLARRSKVDPLSESPLIDGWKVAEPDLDTKMSALSVKCFFAYRGCESTLTLAEVVSHAKDCPHKPPADLDPKEVTETQWYKANFESASNLEIETKHTSEVRNWEKRLQKAVGKDTVDDLCTHAEEQLNIYKRRLPKPGDLMQYAEGQSPLDCLEEAAIQYASAIKLKPRESRLHYMLGRILEEHHYAEEMYGLKKKDTGDTGQELGTAKTAGRLDEILAVCKLHGFTGTPTMENQLKALDAEYHQLKEQGQATKAEYVQTLYLWLSKKVKKDGQFSVANEESWLHRALLKYLDAWSLSEDSWENNMHVGRLLLLQGKSREALQHLQTALALRPSQPALRFYTGVAVLQQEGNSGKEEKMAALYLQQGLEYVMACALMAGGQQDREKPDHGDPLSTVNIQFLRGCFSLATLLTKNAPPGNSIPPEQIHHILVCLAAQGVSQCVCRGEVAQQLEWVLLDSHFALLQALIQQPSTGVAGKQAWVSQRCQALSALIRLASIPPCRELLDMQEKVCQIGVVTVPRSSHALCLLGTTQLAQYDSEPGSEQGQASLVDARRSFQASIELEGCSQTGDPPDKLTKQPWWQERQAQKAKAAKQAASKSTGASGPSEAGPSGKAAGAGAATGRGRGTPGRGGTVAATATASAAKSGAAARGATKAVPAAKAAPAPAARGRAGAAAQPKAAGKASSKTQLAASKSKQDCSAPQTKSQAEAPSPSSSNSKLAGPSINNMKSHVPRLGLARALSRTEDTHQQACSLYQEVIAMAPEVHDAYIELADLLVKTDPLAAVEVYSRFPLKPISEQTFDDAYITGEIVRILMKQEQYDHILLASNLIAYGKVMGLGCLEKYIDVLEGNFKTDLLKNMYAGIHDKSVDDKDLQEFFKFKCWI
ncbi:uncharacterized protein LOC134442896 isoform X2 [Engraulis encrasicolus]|uniref:uncharacterized protein LOC134442896 isoform X2 n=1 Tax=Engraulis encrasicolus TaxID=184585 RepID=UPI002FD501BB